jgi:hypothetical protein
MISITVFLLCFTLKKYELDIGIALGLFAIFGIIRYRTSTIAIKEMTYLFVSIGISVINALANEKMSLTGIIIANSIVVLALFIIEHIWSLKQEQSRKILYNKLDNIKPENHGLLKTDLEKLTGLEINSIDVGNIDCFNNTIAITIHYFNNK